MLLGVLALVGVVVAAVLVLFLLGLAAPQLSRRLPRRVDTDLEHGEELALKDVPGRAGRWLARSLGLSEKVADKASEAGRHEHEALERAKRR